MEISTKTLFNQEMIMGEISFHIASLLQIYFRKYIVTMINNGEELKGKMGGKEAILIEWAYYCMVFILFFI